MTPELDSMVTWDTFFFYGEGELDNEARYDLLEILSQPKRSLFYFRGGSAGITEYENHPNGIALQVLGRYDIVSAVAYRNQLVGDGSVGSTDRRIAVSQEFITFQPKEDRLDVSILYFLYADYETPKSSNFKLEG